MDKQNLQEVIKNVKTKLLNVPTSNRNDETKLWFKNISEFIINILTNVNKTLKHMDFSAQKTILLHIVQCISSLSLLMQVFAVELKEKILLKEGRTCAIKQFQWCLDGLTLYETNALNNSGSFIKWMDEALDAISLIDIEKGNENAVDNCEKAKQSIEEVLSHAMSIAQVTIEKDKLSIRGGCRTVLEELSNLIQQCNKPQPNIAMCNLFVDYVITKLCTLEERVNISVLRLCLRVFLNYTKPLDDLMTYCKSDTFNLDCKFDHLVANYDLHVDRIMQIGLFAIACCTDYNRVIKMQSCLASLEALEGELVPSLTSLFSNKSVEGLSYTYVLQQHWINEVYSLQNFIYLILDAGAFCKIVHEEVITFIEKLEEQMQNFSFSLKPEHFQILINQIKVLLHMVNTFVEDDDDFKNKASTLATCCVIKNLSHEIKAACEILLMDYNVKNNGPSRVVKRCYILATKIKLLHCNLTTDDVLINTNDKNEITLKNNDAHLQETEMNENDMFIKDEAFDKLVQKGQKILKDRSVLYRTPHKSRNFSFSRKHFIENLSTLKNDNQSTNVLRQQKGEKTYKMRVSRFSKVKKNNSTTIDLQITDILDDISRLSSTFSYS